MSDSNEIKNDQKNPRLRLPQAGIKAQEAHDSGEPLTTSSLIACMDNVLLDVMNDRIDHTKAQAIVAVANVIVKTTALELKNRELILSYAYKYEQNIETPSPLQLVAGKQKDAKKRAVG